MIFKHTFFVVGTSILLCSTQLQTQAHTLVACKKPASSINKYERQKITLTDSLYSLEPKFDKKGSCFFNQPLAEIYPELKTKVSATDSILLNIERANNVALWGALTGTIGVGFGIATTKNPLFSNSLLGLGALGFAAALGGFIVSRYLLHDLLDQYNIKLRISLLEEGN